MHYKYCFLQIEIHFETFEEIGFNLSCEDSKSEKNGRENETLGCISDDPAKAIKRELWAA